MFGVRRKGDEKVARRWVIRGQPLARGCLQRDGPSEARFSKAACTHLEPGMMVHWSAKRVGLYPDTINSCQGNKSGNIETNLKAYSLKHYLEK